MPAVIARPRLTLRQPCRESAPVREAKQLAREVGYDSDPHMVAFALALIEARDTWHNRPQRGAGMTASFPSPPDPGNRDRTGRKRNTQASRG